MEKIRLAQGIFKLFDVTEDELDKMESGSDESIYLNFSIFSFSTASSFLIVLLTVHEMAMTFFFIFCCVTIMGFFIGTLLIFLWLRARKQSKKIFQRIRNRLVVFC